MPAAYFLYIVMCYPVKTPVALAQAVLQKRHGTAEIATVGENGVAYPKEGFTFILDTKRRTNPQISMPKLRMPAAVYYDGSLRNRILSNNSEANNKYHQPPL
jgi:hypothetical protein